MRALAAALALAALAAVALALLDAGDATTAAAPEAATSRGAPATAPVAPAPLLQADAAPAVPDAALLAEPQRREAVPQGRRIAGRVTDERGAVLAGCTVEVWASQGDGAERERTSTGDDGRFEVTRCSPERYEVRITCAERLPWRGRHAALDPDLEVALALGVEAAGFVVDRNGGAVAGARVVLKALDTHGTVLTGADGRFRIRGLRPTSLGVLGVDAEGFAAHVEYPVWWRRDAENHLRIVLDRALEAAGSVRDAAGRPLAGASVTPALDETLASAHRFLADTGDWPAAARPPVATSGRDGSFALPRLRAGAGELIVRFGRHSERVAFAPGSGAVAIAVAVTR